jgi:hypothetical protein
MRLPLGLTLAFFVALALAVVAYRLAVAPDSVLATHGGADVISVDMVTTGNTSSALGPLEGCIQISAGNSFTIDVTVQGVPPHNTNGTQTPADDTCGIIAYSYRLNYPSAVLTVTASTVGDAGINILARNSGSTPINFGDSAPDSDGAFQPSVLDTGNAVPESGFGVLERLTISSSGGAPAGVYSLQLTANSSGHVPASGGTYFPHSLRSGAIAIGQPCDGPAADDDGDGVHDIAEDGCGGDRFNPSVRPERIDGTFAGISDDGDASVDEALPAGSAAFDCDGDGWPGNQENLIYGLAPSTATDQDPCGSNGWPADLVGNNNTLNIGDLNSFIIPERPFDGHSTFNKIGHALDDDGDTVIESNEDPAGEPGVQSYNLRRWNLQQPPHDSGTLISIGDLNALNPGTAATTAGPPMFGGQPAFFTNAGQCPFPP